MDYALFNDGGDHHRGYLRAAWLRQLRFGGHDRLGVILRLELGGGVVGLRLRRSGDELGLRLRRPGDELGIGLRIRRRLGVQLGQRFRLQLGWQLRLWVGVGLQFRLRPRGRRRTDD
jgi:hypothetical protein